MKTINIIKHLKYQIPECKYRDKNDGKIYIHGLEIRKWLLDNAMPLICNIYPICLSTILEANLPLNVRNLFITTLLPAGRS